MKEIKKSKKDINTNISHTHSYYKNYEDIYRKYNKIPESLRTLAKEIFFDIHNIGDIMKLSNEELKKFLQESSEVFYQGKYEIEIISIADLIRKYTKKRKTKNGY